MWPLTLRDQHSRLRAQAAGNAGGAYPWPQDNLSAEYFFDGDLTDSSGNGLDLTGSGTVTTASGYLDVVNAAYVYRNSSTLMNGVTSFTVCFWIYFEGSVPSTTYATIGKTASTWRFYWTTNQRLRALLYPGALYGDITDSSLSVDAWHHVAITWSANGSVQCWLDNTLQTSTVSTPSLAAIATTTGQFRCLDRQHPNTRLDNVLIYENKVLTTDEIAAIYNYGRVTP